MLLKVGTLQKIVPSDERIQILQESCKMIQNLQDSCKNLARYQSRPKNKSGYKCFRKHLWSKFLFTAQVTKPISMKKNSQNSKSCKNLARILQDFEFRKKYLCVFGSYLLIYFNPMFYLFLLLSLSLFSKPNLALFSKLMFISKYRSS